LLTKVTGTSVDCDVLSIGLATATGLQQAVAAVGADDTAADSATGRSSIV